MKTDALLITYADELKRTLGDAKPITVKMVRRRVEVSTRAYSLPLRYTIKEVGLAIEALKKRPNFNPAIPSYLTM